MGSISGNKVWQGKGLDWVEAVGEALTIKALDPNNPKQVDAARLMLQETALAEQRQQEQTAGQDATRQLIADLAAIARAALQQQDADAVDAEEIR
jgi:hypothetical protein